MPSIILMKNRPKSGNGQVEDQIFGGFAIHPWTNDARKTPKHFGTSDCFLFNLTKDKKIVAKKNIN